MKAYNIGGVLQDVHEDDDTPCTSFLPWLPTNAETHTHTKKKKSKAHQHQPDEDFGWATVAAIEHGWTLFRPVAAFRGVSLFAVLPSRSK